MSGEDYDLVILGSGEGSKFLAWTEARNLHYVWTRGSVSGSKRLSDQPDGLQGMRRVASACARRRISVRQGRATRKAWSWLPKLPPGSRE